MIIKFWCNQEVPKGFVRAWYRGIPAFFNWTTDELWGRNWFWNFLIEINSYFDAYVVEVEEFPIIIEE